MAKIPRKVILALAAVGAAAVGLRFWAFTWGMPLKFAHIDESVVVFYSLRIAAGEWNSGFYDYPALFLNLTAGLFRLGHAVARLFGATDWEGLLALYQTGDARFFTLTARALSASFALAALAVAVDAGRRWKGWFMAVSAAALLAVNPLHVLHSHYGTVDVTAAFFTLVAMDRIALYGQDGRRWDGVAAAVAVGLGAATKYYPAVLGLLLLGIALKVRRRDAWALLAAMAGGFVAGSPFTLLTFGDFWARLLHLYPKIIGTPGGAGMPWAGAIRQLIVHAGPLPCLLAAVGLYAAAKEKGYGGFFALAWGVLFLYIGVWRGQLAHYGLPLYAGLFLLAARGAMALGGWRAWAPAAAVAAALAVSVVGALRVGRYISTPDSRFAAASWVRANVPAESRLVRFAHTPEFAATDPFSVKVDFENKLLAPLAAGEKAPPLLAEADYLVFATHYPEDDLRLAALEKAYRRVYMTDGPPPRFPHHPRVFVFAVKP